MIRIFYGWWVVVACFVLSLYVGGVVFFGFTAFFQPIRNELGWSYTQISFASSLRGVEMGLFAPLIGFIVSRYGPRRLMLAGMVTVGIGLLLLSQCHSLLTFYGAFFLMAFGAGGCASVVTLTAVANWFHRDVGKAMGIMAAGIGAGGLIVPLVVELITAWGWRPTLVILGLGAWIVGIPLALVIRDKPEDYGYLPDGDTPSASSHAPAKVKEKREIGFRDAIRNAGFLTLILAEFIRLLGVTAVIIHVMPYLQDAGIQRAAAGIVAASLPLVSSAGRLGFGWLSDRYPKRVVMATAYMIMSGGLFVFIFAKPGWVLILFVLLFAPGFGGSMVLRGAIVREYFGKESFGKLLGVIMGAGSIGGILGPTAAGWIFDQIGTYRPIWVIMAILSFCASLMVLRVRPLISSPLSPGIPETR